MAWNIAADLCVQQLLEKYDSHRIGGTVNIREWMDQYPELCEGMSTERYFRLIFNNERDPGDSYDDGIQRKGDPGDGESGGGQSDDDGDDSGSESGGDSDGGTPGKQQDSGSSEPKTGTVRSTGGSSADGVQRSYESKRDLATAGNNLAKLQDVRKELANDPSIGQGTDSGAIRQALEDRLCPQPDPFDRLRSIVSQTMPADTGAEEYTFRKRGRRTESDDEPKPGIERYAPRCTIVVDTSGSMCCQERTTRAMTAIAQGCARVKRPRVIAWDASLQQDGEISNHRQFDWSGCGGTDMSQAVEYAAKQSPRPDAVVLVTDGGTPWPSSRLPMPLIVALVANDGTPPDWAITVDLTKGGNQHVC